MAAKPTKHKRERFVNGATADSFPWVSSRSLELEFTTQGDFLLAFPPRCPVLMHFVQFTVDHRITPNHHNFFELSMIFDGEGEFIVENHHYRLLPGDLLVIGSREFHTLRVDYGAKLKIASVHFQPELIHTPGAPELDFEYLQPYYYRTSNFSHRIARRLLPENLVLERMASIHAEIQARREGFALAVKTYLNDILLEVSRHYQQAGGELIPQEQRVRDFERLREVFNFLRKNCHEQMSLEQVSAMAHMSSSYFCRFFKKVTGITLTEYVLKLRIDLAMEFLADGGMSVTEIAYAAGFSSHSYFDRLFKRCKGLSPLEYRRQLKI